MNEIDLVGKVLDGRYRVVSRLGAGAMATVYLAHQESLDREVVVKVPDAALAADEEFLLRFQQEIRSWGDTSFDIYLDVENVGNLINSDWGRVDSYTAPSNVAPAIVGLSADGSQFVLTPSPSYQGTPETIVQRPAIAALPSVHRIQLGARFRF